MAQCSFASYLSHEKEEELRQIAAAIVAPGKGILAADESIGEPGWPVWRSELSTMLQAAWPSACSRWAWRTWRRTGASTARSCSRAAPTWASTSRASSCSTRRSTRRRPRACPSSRCCARRASSPASRWTRAWSTWRARAARRRRRVGVLMGRLVNSLVTTRPGQPGRPLRPVQEGRVPVRQVALRDQDQRAHALAPGPAGDGQRAGALRVHLPAGVCTLLWLKHSHRVRRTGSCPSSSPRCCPTATTTSR